MARKVTARRVWVSTAAAWLFGFLIFLPILWMVLTSFKTELEAFSMPPKFLFFHWTTENYATVQERSDYLHHALNSIIIAGGSTLIAMLIAIPAAWSMAFAPTKRTKDVLLWMLSTKMMPSVGVLVPIYLIFRDFGLLDTRAGLVMILCLGNLPIVIWMLFTYFKEIPKDILEAARMDGATIGRELVYVLTPMAVPGPRLDAAAQFHPGVERGVLDAEPFDAGRRAAHDLHRVLFEPRGPVLGQAVGRLDARHRADPRPRLVQPAAARPRPDLRRRQVAGEQSIMGQITLQGVRKSFGPVNIIKDANLEIEDGSFVVFVGPSGCGKTTLLRLIAGLEDVTGGQILIDGKNVVDVPPAKRGLSMVFQSYALYPHMSVRGNIALRPEDGRPAAGRRSTARSRPPPRRST